MWSLAVCRCLQLNSTLFFTASLLFPYSWSRSTCSPQHHPRMVPRSTYKDQEHFIHTLWGENHLKCWWYRTEYLSKPTSTTSPPALVGGLLALTLATYFPPKWAWHSGQNSGLVFLGGTYCTSVKILNRPGEGERTLWIVTGRHA